MIDVLARPWCRRSQFKRLGALGALILPPGRAGQVEHTLHQQTGRRQYPEDANGRTSASAGGRMGAGPCLHPAQRAHGGIERAGT